MMTARIVHLVLAGLTVIAPAGPIYPNSERLFARANRECRALRQSGSRETIYLAYRKKESVVYRCQPMGNAVRRPSGRSEEGRKHRSKL